MLITNQSVPIISVIVATRNRKAVLGNFLEALRRLPSRPTWELIVVDNGSTDGTDQLLLSASKELPIVCICERLPGKSRSLNRGLAVAKGEFLLFTDDDVVPESQWLVALYDASLAFPDANVFGGKIVINPERIPSWIANSYNLKTMLASEQDLGDSVRRFGDGQYPIGPNLAIRRRILEQKSLCWPVNFGPGTKIPLGDERAFLMPISPPHFRDRLYVPHCVVLHSIGGRPLSVRNAVIRCFLGGFSAGLVDRRYRSFRPRQYRRAWNFAMDRLRQSSSFWELMCMVSRALGVIAGTLSPYPPVVHDPGGQKH
jgi:glycosyltransferase involved in cell wall biosynthesis